MNFRYYEEAVNSDDGSEVDDSDTDPTFDINEEVRSKQVPQYFSPEDLMIPPEYEKQQIENNYVDTDPTFDNNEEGHSKHVPQYFTAENLMISPEYEQQQIEDTHVFQFTDSNSDCASFKSMHQTTVTVEKQNTQFLTSGAIEHKNDEDVIKDVLESVINQVSQIKEHRIRKKKNTGNEGSVTKKQLISHSTVHVNFLKNFETLNIFTLISFF